MLSIEWITEPDYLLDQSRADYYFAGGEPPGTWWEGGAALALGLQGAVKPWQLKPLFQGFAPKKPGRPKAPPPGPKHPTPFDGRALIQNAGEKNHQAGWDLTFSAPKSVSVLWSVADPDLRQIIQKLHADAVKQALQYLQDTAAYTRRGKGGKKIEKAKLLVATFEHAASRELDANLHTHCAVVNVCVREDGSTGRIADAGQRTDIQAQLDGGANGIEQALDLLDDGGAQDTPYRHVVIAAIADLFLPKTPPLELHIEFVQRLGHRADPCIKVFCLNYDPLIERAAERAKVRLVDGYIGTEHAFFDPVVFEERIGRIRGSHKGRQFDETVKPLHLLKLHGSLGWYECQSHGVRRCAFGASPPADTKRLMVPPQRRKATDTMLPPYAAMWSSFRGSLGQNASPINRLACIGYGFADEHVNAVIEAALGRSDFTVLIFTKALADFAWNRWST